MSEVAECLSSKGVKLFVNDACLNQYLCTPIQKTFGASFDTLNVINCDLESNEDECDNAREDLGHSLGLPLWYVDAKAEYYTGGVGKIRSETGC